jgi:hypothetical protein
VLRGRLAVGIGVAVVAAIAQFLLIGCGDSEGGSNRSKQAPPAARGPVAVTLGSLRALADSVGHPIYWAGQRHGGYELTVDANGNIFIRYLEGKVTAGSRRQTSLTVGTYPYAGAYGTLQRAARAPGARAARTPDGGLVVASANSPDNAHIAYPGADIQIEVYDPKAGRAFELATAGAISRIN